MSAFKRKSKKEEEPLEETPEASEGNESSDAKAKSEPQTIEEELEAAIREREEFKERWQRAAADYQNLKRRQLTDIESAVRRAQSPMLEEALVVLDYLDMALASPVSEPEAKNLMIGVEMTRQQFMGVLERQGITAIDTSGEFDPALHQAVATVESEEHEAGAIPESTRTG